MATRMVDKCTQCGHLSERKLDIFGNLREYNGCAWCKSMEYTQVEYPKIETDEVDILRTALEELEYIVNKAFNELKPKDTDCFGCIEMCDYLKKKYDLNDDVYELAGPINAILVTSYEHGEYVPEYGRLSGKQSGIITDDGRLLTYNLLYYSSSTFNDISYTFINEEDIKLIEKNTRSKLLEIITYMVKFKPCTTGKGVVAFPSADLDYDYETMKQARKKIVEYIKPEIDRKKTAELRNKLVEEITKPVKITDPNYVESATCPNCHKNSVYRISNVKRGASIGFFGLFSKNIGKTMECRSCGYKW